MTSPRYRRWVHMVTFSAMPAAILVHADSGAGPAIADRLIADGYQVHALGAVDAQRSSIGASVAKLADDVAAELLVINAPSFPPSLALETAPADFSAALDMGIHTVFSACREAARSAHSAGRPLVIVNVVTVMAMVGLEGRAAEACVSAGVLAATKALAAEWGPMGIRASTVVVGPTDSWPTTTGTLDEIPGVIPLGNTVGADDVAGAVSLVASSDAAASTGQAFIVDGGWLAHGWRRE